MRKRLYILHGPNLHNIGCREPEIYGKQTFASFFSQLQKRHPSVDFRAYQTHSEANLIRFIYSISPLHQTGVLINPGALTHTSIALLDALRNCAFPTVEVHLSDITSRESFRQTSLIRSACLSSIMGKGLDGYKEGIEILLSSLKGEE